MVQSLARHIIPVRTLIVEYLEGLSDADLKNERYDQLAVCLRSLKKVCSILPDVSESSGKMTDEFRL